MIPSTRVERGRAARELAGDVDKYYCDLATVGSLPELWILRSSEIPLPCAAPLRPVTVYRRCEPVELNALSTTVPDEILADHGFLLTEPMTCVLPCCSSSLPDITGRPTRVCAGCLTRLRDQDVSG